MHDVVLGLVSLVVGAASIEPLAGALSGPVVGVAVPTRVTDLAGYLVAPASPLASPDLATQAFIGPAAGVVAASGAQQAHLRELAGLGFAGGVAVAALTYAVLKRVLG